MAVTNKFSEQVILELVRKEHDLENDTLKAALMTTGFTFDPATDSTWADVSASEISGGNGYTSGGQTLSSVAASISSNVIQIDCDNISWTASTGPIADCVACVVYNSSHASDTIVCCIEYGATYSTAEDTTHLIDTSNGLAKLTPNPS